MQEHALSHRAFPDRRFQPTKRVKESRRWYDAIDAIVYDIVRHSRGTVSAEHGIGLKKKPFLPFSRTPEELALMRLIKRAIDPDGILNPGKVL